MHLLNSMTGASPETRFVLFACAARLGHAFQSGVMDELAAHLGISKRHLGVALDYLVREGYLWKIKSPSDALEGDRRKVRFYYYLTPEARLMWSVWTAEECSWKDEIDHVLSLPKSVEAAGSKKRVAITVQMRLVWIALLMASNRAGYVVGVDFGTLSKMLGMSKEQFYRAAKALSRKGVVSIAVSHLARTPLFGPTPPVYKLQPQSTKWKLIKLGVSLGDSQLAPLRFLFKLEDFYLKAAKHSRKGRLPSQSSYLPDHRYFELAKIFHNQKLRALVYHVCRSAIFLLAPCYSSISERADLQDEPNQTRRDSEVALREQVMSILANGLSSMDMKNFAKANKKQIVDESSDVDGAYWLGVFTLRELTNEVANLVQLVSRQLRVFVGCLGGELRVLEHQKNEHMATILHDQAVSFLELHTEPGKEPKQVWVTSCVLSVLVPNEEKYDNCLVLGDVLLMTNSRVTHPSIQQVDKLICY